MAHHRFLIFDVSSFFYRYWYARQNATNSQGEFTGAIVGTWKAMNALIEAKCPDRVAMVFDVPGKTERDEIYPEYKAGRDEKPQELHDSIDAFFDLAEIHGIPALRIPGYEADDVICTLANRASLRDFRVLIASDDKDLAQVVDARTALYLPSKDERLDEQGVVAKFGVKPSQMVDYLALVGDASDNIPGVERVGKKTAVKILDRFGSVSGLKEAAAAGTLVPGGGVSDKICHNIKDAIQSRSLDMAMRLVRYMPCEVPLDVERMVKDKTILDGDLGLRTWCERHEIPMEDVSCSMGAHDVRHPQAANSMEP